MIYILMSDKVVSEPIFTHKDYLIKEKNLIPQENITILN